MHDTRAHSAPSENNFWVDGIMAQLGVNLFSFPNTNTKGLNKSAPDKTPGLNPK